MKCERPLRILYQYGYNHVALPQKTNTNVASPRRGDVGETRVTDNAKAKERLAKKLNEIVQRQGLNQGEIAELLGMPQPKVSAIRNYKLNGISLQRLLVALTALGQHVEIVVRPSTHASPARIYVAA